MKDVEFEKYDNNVLVCLEDRFSGIFKRKILTNFYSIRIKVVFVCKSLEKYSIFEVSEADLEG